MHGSEKCVAVSRHFSLVLNIATLDYDYEHEHEHEMQD